MKDAGDAVLGVGEASGKARARLAAREALGSPLQSLEGKSAPTGVIYNLTSGSDLTIQEVRLRMDCFVRLLHEWSAVS
jgi:cell division protein FtsZ